MILSVPFYEREGDGRVRALDLLKYLEMAKYQKMDLEISLELLKSAQRGVYEAWQKDPKE